MVYYEMRNERGREREREREKERERVVREKGDARRRRADARVSKAASEAS